MKKYLSYITAALFLSLLVFTNCGGGGSDDDGGDQDDLEARAEHLVSGQSTFVDVDLNGNQSTADWSSFTLTFTGNANGGSYATSGVPENFENVWPASGEWEFNNTTGTEILRDEAVVMDLQLSLESQTYNLQFDISTSSTARTGVIDGGYDFELQIAE